MTQSSYQCTGCNTKMAEMSVASDGFGNPVLAVQCNYEKSYAFVEVGDIAVFDSFHLADRLVHLVPAER